MKRTGEHQHRSDEDADRDADPLDGVAPIGDADDAAEGLLLSRVAERDRAAFADLYRRAAPRLFGLALFMLQHRGDAEEVLQETFVTVWRAADRYDRSIAAPRIWLSTILRRKAIDRLRATRLADRADVDLDLFMDDVPTPEEQAQMSTDARALWACVDRLGTKFRLVILAYYFGGMTLAEHARQEGIPLGTVKSRLRLAIAKLRACLDSADRIR